MANDMRDLAPRKILFIGNSFTARNDLPGLLTQLAAARGKQFQHRLISGGGASLRTHWNAGEAAKAIAEGQYDDVVLQEQSTLPIKNARRMHENVRLFDEAIKHAGAKTVLYMTWARQHAPESQQAITEAYTSIGRELGALVVPVGLAWQSFLGNHDQPVLHDPDQSHPTLAGSYLAAAVFLAALFQENPVGIDGEVTGLAKKDRGLLQRAAWKVGKSILPKLGD
ncbi:SGNH/GDSL hydrolase family protein [Singulisphaera sp. Ch08]|uniref:SGNH/GDSL hydrolase family protein n=1 Tax=Singulisphaera sp. Ch08 TaxID=3120278 RepID=A0AAU7CBE6_9BACT